MQKEALKKAAAIAAIPLVKNVNVLGVGSGSTVNYFIDALASIKNTFQFAIPASEASKQRLIKAGIAVGELNHHGNVDLYVDGADEINQHLQMIKGGGGALTREKILATAAKRFICIADHSKKVAVLGKNFPIAVEVIPMARSFVARKIFALGGEPVYRENFITDNGNVILDVYHFTLLDPKQIETNLKQIPGVVENGIFANRTADILLLSDQQGVSSIQK